MKSKMTIDYKYLVLYLVPVISSVGYYANMPKDDNFIYFWLILFVISAILIFINSFRKQKKQFLVFDILFLIWVIFIPRINTPYGISRLVMAVIGSIYAYFAARREPKKKRWLNLQSEFANKKTEGCETTRPNFY